MAAEVSGTFRAHGERLSARLRREPTLSGEQAVSVLLEIARAVARYHEQGTLHREISADSVYLESDSQTVVLMPPSAGPVSFGGRSTDLQRCPAELCTPRVVEVPASLEAAQSALLASGIPLDPRRIDVYQMGTLLCQLLTGEPVDAYLRSPRVKSQIAPGNAALLDGALGHCEAERILAADTLVRALEAALSPAIQAEYKDDTTPSLLTSLTGSEDTAVGSSAEQPRPAPPGLPFTKLGHYEILHRLGRGGMGEVYRGYERSLDRPVALKVLPARLARNESFVRRFYTEASAAAGLVHPNVVQIYSIGEDNGHHYFAMQFVEGESLSELLARRGRLDVEETLAIVEQVLLGLSAAHARGLVHRDIKPGNILLDSEQRRVWLADFGLVKTLEGSGMTTSGVIMGTADYISPEQGRGKPVDVRSDLYSLGAVMYRMLSGRLPFQADSPTAMIFQHAYEPVPPLHNFAPDVPWDLTQLVESSLAKMPEERPASAEEFLTRLRACRRRDLVGPGVAGTSGSREARRQRTIIIEAPRFDEPLAAPESLLDELPADAQPRVRDRLLSLFRRAAPDLARELQTTQQQLDGAVAEYRARRGKLGTLVAEAEAALRELQSLAAEYRSEAASPDLAADEAKRTSHMETAALLEQQAAEQQEQLATMRIQLAKVDAVLQRLQGRRDLLKARLEVARAQIRMAGGRVENRPWWMALGRLSWKRWAQLGVLVGASCVLMYSLSYPIAYLFRTNADEAPARNRLPDTSTQESNWGGPPRNLQLELEHRIALSPDGRWLVNFFHNPITTGPGDPMDEIKLWDLEAGSELLTLEDPHRSRALAISPDKSVLISAGVKAPENLHEIKLWDLSTGKVRHTISTAVPYDAAVGFSPDSTKAYSLVQPDGITLGTIDVATGELSIISMPHDSDQATSAAFSPAEDIAAIGITSTGVGRTALDIRDMRAERLLASLSTGNAVRRLTFSPDGRMLVGSVWGAIVVWSAPDWQEVARITPKQNYHEQLAVSRDRRFVAAIHNGELELWDMKTNERRLLIGSGCLDVEFTSGGTVVAAPRNSQFRFFDPLTGREVMRPKL